MVHRRKYAVPDRFPHHQAGNTSNCKSRTFGDETNLRRRGVVAQRIENEVLVIGGLHHLNTDTPMETESWTINKDESIGNEKLVGDALLNFAFSRSFLVEENFCQ